MHLRQRSPHVILLLVILLAGGALRFYKVGELPPGLYRDEAYYGLDALRVLGGDFALYFAANNGREGLFIYALAAGVALLGRTPEALRATSAAIGLLTIAAMPTSPAVRCSRRAWACWARLSWPSTFGIWRSAEWPFGRSPCRPSSAWPSRSPSLRCALRRLAGVRAWLAWRVSRLG
jgi:hypothetical protein